MESQAYESTPQPKTAQAFVDACNLEYAAEFVPQSRSRNAEEKNPSLNWRITIRKGRASITTDYMQGIAHAKGYEKLNGNTVAEDKARRACAEHGDAWSNDRRIRAITPDLVDVLYCLVMDADVLNYSGFDDWANSLGYDTDSRKAEKIYRDCMSIALQLQQIIDLPAAQAAFEDF